MDEKLAKELRELPFEEAMKRLEAVVGRMETGKLSLDAMISSFEEGSLLSSICGEKLKAVEKKIEMLVSEDNQGGKWRDISDGDDSDNTPPEPDGGDLLF